MAGASTTRHTVLVSLAALGRPVFWVGFYAAILSAWVALFMMAQASPLASFPGADAAEFWASLCRSAGEADPLVLFGMWALMSAAMMLPTFVPALRVFGEIGDVQASDGRSMTALVAGYALIWLAFSAVAAVAQMALARLGTIAPDGSSLSPWLTAGLLMGAGAYQLSLIKAACLAKCRHPLMFFIQRWRPGWPAALGMGLRLGAYCAGCCWALMSLGFVGGAMNLMWMGVATLFMTFEKLPGLGGYLTKPSGFALLAAGIAVAARTILLT